MKYQIYMEIRRPKFRRIKVQGRLRRSVAIKLSFELNYYCTEKRRVTFYVGEDK